MTGIRRLWSLEPERRREEGTETEGLEEVAAAVAAEQGEEGEMWVGYEDKFFFSFLLPAQPQTDKTEKVGRTTSSFFFLFADVRW